MSPAHAARVERGDWQTPLALAAAVLGVVRRLGAEPRAIVEPTCGDGAFLIAAREVFPAALLVGFDVDEGHVGAARAALGGTARLAVRDFFDIDWSAELSDLAAPLLVVGNPPWVTSSTLGALSSTHAPEKRNVDGARGVDAITGASNFDVSEAMTWRLVEAALHTARPFTVALLVKRTVARKIARRALASDAPVRGAIRAVDARRSFGVAVDAVLLSIDGPRSPSWVELGGLTDDGEGTALALVEGRVARVSEALFDTRDLEVAGAPSAHVWRSGIKHDCADVMEVDRAVVDLEDDYVYPLLKGSDVAAGRLTPRRSVIVPQRRVGDDTRALALAAPKTWAWLVEHEARLSARKSRVYAGRPRFSIFGVGPYAFAPFKVAVSGLHKRLSFAVVAPHEGRPVMLDDTCYFLPCEDEDAALALREALSSPRATRFFEARIAWDEKRPITKSLLSRLRVEALIER
ncbi:MAG: hypothetical protein U0414_10295 [Polyangiaceae bacterium]